MLRLISKKIGVFLFALIAATTPAAVAHADGVNWTQRQVPAGDWTAVAFGEGKFVAVAWTGNAMYSSDGVNWVSGVIDWASKGVQANSSAWYNVTYGNGKFVAVANTGTHRVMVSEDGETWTLHDSVNQNDWYGIAYGAGRFVAVAGDGSDVTRLMTSQDGESWTAITLPSALDSYQWGSVEYLNGEFVAVAENYKVDAIITSTDGQVWTQQTTPENLPGYENSSAYAWSDITYGNGTYVAVASGHDFVGGISTKRLMSGTSLSNLSFRTIAIGDWRSITFNGELFVAVAANAPNYILTSPDGINWTLRNPPTDQQGNALAFWWGITHANGLTVAVSYVGHLMTSGTYTPPSPDPEPPTQQQTPAAVVTTTVAPTTTTTVPAVRKLSKLPDTGSSNSLLLFAAMTVVLGGAVSVLRKRVLN